MSMICEVCGDALRADNAMGACQRTRQCKRLYDTRWRRANRETVRAGGRERTRRWRERVKAREMTA